MTNEKTQGDELGAIGKQTMAHAYSAMDYYFDHLRKAVPGFDPCGARRE